MRCRTRASQRVPGSARVVAHLLHDRGAAASGRDARPDLSGVAFPQLPEAVGLSALDHLKWRRAVELLVRPLQPFAESFVFDDIGESVAQAHYLVGVRRMFQVQFRLLFAIPHSMRIVTF